MNISIKSKRIIISILFIILTLSTSCINFGNNFARSEEFDKSEVITSQEDQLIIYEFSPSTDRIYVNYTKIEITTRFESPDANSSKVRAYFSADLINWNITNLENKKALSETLVYYSGEIGPFPIIGEYYLKINATRGISELASVKLKFNVEAVNGIIFVDFEYLIKTPFNNGSQYSDILISVLGDNLNFSTVAVVTDKQPDKIIKMQLVNNSINRFNATLGPINSWSEKIKLTFRANSTAGIYYKNDRFYFKKDPIITPENFWKSNFPAIIVVTVIFGSMSGYILWSRRKPPKDYDLKIKGKKEEKRKNE